MKKKFITDTIILTIGGILIKILGMAIRVLTTRVIGSLGIGLYMMILPCFNLFIVIGSLSLPTAISKIVAERKYSNRKIIFTTIVMALLFDFLLMMIIFLLAPFISSNLLANKDLYYPILCISLTIPFITISSIIRGYFFGSLKMLPHIISNLGEQVVRIILIVLVLPLLLDKGLIISISGLVLFNIISEVFGIIIMLLFIPSKKVINLFHIKPDRGIIKDVSKIAIPTTMGRLASSFGLFLEPVIITFVFLRLSYESTFITSSYGVIEGYVLPIVTMPEFISGALGVLILPIATRYFKERKIDALKNRLKLTLLLSLGIGFIFTLILFFFPNLCLRIIFGTEIGANYLKVASLVYFLSYAINPIISVMQGVNLTNKAILITTTGMILRLMILFSLTFLDIGMYGLIFSYLGYFLYVLVLDIIVLRKKLNFL